MKLYSAYMLKPVSTSVPASDAYMTLLPNYKGKTNMATLFRTIQEDIFDHQLNFVGIQVRTQQHHHQHSLNMVSLLILA